VLSFDVGNNLACWTAERVNLSKAGGGVFPENPDGDS